MLVLDQMQLFSRKALIMQITEDVVGRRGNGMTSAKQSNKGQVLKNDNPTVYTYLFQSRPHVRRRAETPAGR